MAAEMTFADEIMKTVMKQLERLEDDGLASSGVVDRMKQAHPEWFDIAEIEPKEPKQ